MVNVENLEKCQSLYCEPCRNHCETKSLLFFKTLVTGFWNATAQAKSPYTLIPSTVTNNE